MEPVVYNFPLDTLLYPSLPVTLSVVLSVWSRDQCVVDRTRKQKEGTLSSRQWQGRQGKPLCLVLLLNVGHINTLLFWSPVSAHCHDKPLHVETLFPCINTLLSVHQSSIKYRWRRVERLSYSTSIMHGSLSHWCWKQFRPWNHAQEINSQWTVDRSQDLFYYSNSITQHRPPSITQHHHSQVRRPCIRILAFAIPWVVRRPWYTFIRHLDGHNIL